VEKTFSILPDHGAILQENTLQSMLDIIYPETPSPVNIVSHLVWENDSFRLPPLCNLKSSVLQETLEINSATCILECDRGAYETGTWDIRAGLEIPVSRNAIYRTANLQKYIQIDKGSKPFVVPQEAAEHEQIGLIFHDHDSFL
jgi:CRISPR-associated endonuclease/helicase Cas3